MRRAAYERGLTRRPIAEVPAGMRLLTSSTSVPLSARADVARVISSWELKRRVGFGTPSTSPQPGDDAVLSLRVLEVRIVEPVRVVWADGSGFGYETRPGHPLRGEESFVLDADGVFTARSISRGSGLWRILTPVLRIMQRRALAGYLRVVDETVRMSGETCPKPGEVPPALRYGK